jgi:PKHD-type hydroxylase
MSGESWQLKTDHVNDWAVAEHVFTPEECASIIKIGDSKLEEAWVIGEKNLIRKSRISWLSAMDVKFAFQRVTDAVLDLNEKFFNFDLFGFSEGFQFTRYDSPGGRYGKHTDKLIDGPVRKLSVTIQLSNPSEYEGGDMMLHCAHEPMHLPKGQGLLIAFPSYVLHEVTPVTRGTRHSLVAWISGKPFR